MCRAGALGRGARFYTFRVSDRRSAYSVSGTWGKQTFASSGWLGGTARVRLHVQVTAGRRVCRAWAPARAACETMAGASTFAYFLAVCVSTYIPPRFVLCRLAGGPAGSLSFPWKLNLKTRFSALDRRSCRKNIRLSYRLGCIISRPIENDPMEGLWLGWQRRAVAL